MLKFLSTRFARPAPLAKNDSRLSSRHRKLLENALVHLKHADGTQSRMAFQANTVPLIRSVHTDVSSQMSSADATDLTLALIADLSKACTRIAHRRMPVGRPGTDYRKYETIYNYALIVGMALEWRALKAGEGGTIDLASGLVPPSGCNRLCRYPMVWRDLENYLNADLNDGGLREVSQVPQGPLLSLLRSESSDRQAGDIAGQAVEPGILIAKGTSSFTQVADEPEHITSEAISHTVHDPPLPCTKVELTAGLPPGSEDESVLNNPEEKQPAFVSLHPDNQPDCRALGWEVVEVIRDGLATGVLPHNDAGDWVQVDPEGRTFLQVPEVFDWASQQLSKPCSGKTAFNRFKRLNITVRSRKKKSDLLVGARRGQKPPQRGVVIEDACVLWTTAAPRPAQTFVIRHLTKRPGE